MLFVQNPRKQASGWLAVGAVGAGRGRRESAQGAGEAVWVVAVFTVDCGYIHTSELRNSTLETHALCCTSVIAP